jgi:hypothetical protein
VTTSELQARPHWSPAPGGISGARSCRGANVIVNARSNQAEADAVAGEAEAVGVHSLVVMGEADEKATVERMRAQSDKVAPIRRSRQVVFYSSATGPCSHRDQGVFAAHPPP